MYPLIGSIQSSRRKGGGVANMTTTFSDGVATLSYTPLNLERNKFAKVLSLLINPRTSIKVGDTLVATITGQIIGPFAVGTHQYQWYRLTAERGATPQAIAGATNSTYTLVTADIDHYIVCYARFGQVGGTNNLSGWYRSRMTDRVAATSSDINHAWLDFFNIEDGLSVSSTWNTDVNPSLVNLATQPGSSNWTTVDASKPSLSVSGGISKLVFTNAHRVAGSAMTFAPVSEIWIKGKFTANNGAMIGWGSQTLFGMNSSNQWFIRDTTGFATAGDLNEHVFRIVLNGANSIFQVDKGTENPFTQNFTSATSLAFGQTFSGANPGDCEIKRFQRTVHNTLLTAQEVADKWAFHGF